MEAVNQINHQNRVLSFSDPYLVTLLQPSENTNVVKREDVVKEATFQLPGDLFTIRKVVDEDGDFVLLRAYPIPDGSFYKVHYTWLRPNRALDLQRKMQSDRVF